MTILWLTLLLVTFFAFGARYFAVPSSALPASVSPNKLMALLAAASPILVSGLRNNIGDTVFYMHSYRITDFRVAIYLDQKDIGFNFFQLVLQMISKDPQILVFTTALITNALIVIGIYKYSRLFEISMFVYIASGAFIVSMNGIRQYLAAAILFAATGFILRGSFVKYALVVLFASLFHQSALIMLPIYWIVRREAWTKMTMLMVGVAVAIVFGFNQFQTLLFSALQGTSYSEYEKFTEGGANVIRVMFFAMPLVIAYFGREKLRLLYPKIDIFVNLSLIGTIIMIISTQNWIFARIAIYFSLYQIVLVAWIIKAFRRKDQKLIALGLLLVYAAFFFYENVLALGLQYRSDYITWFT